MVEELANKENNPACRVRLCSNKELIYRGRLKQDRPETPDKQAELVGFTKMFLF